MMRAYQPGDFVACYLTNNEVFEQLLTWGIVLEVSETLNDILVLDHIGNKSWFPSRRWRPLNSQETKQQKTIDVIGKLA